MQVKLAVLLIFSSAYLFGQSNAASAKQEVSVKFMLSDTETLKLENLRLKKQNLDLQINQAQVQYGNELQSFITQTLGAHNNPTGVYFDVNKWQFAIQEKEEKKEPAKEAIPPKLTEPVKK